MIKSINIKGELLELSQPIVMGILNATPDSFYSGSRKQTEEQIINRVQEIITQGGTIVDVGGQSSRPDSAMLNETEEMERLHFALTVINKHFPDVILSVDTFYSGVAKRCVEQYGVAIINDISGGEIDNKMFETVAELNVPYILMHMRGTPQTMQSYTNYDNFIQEIFYYFSKKISILNQLGVNDVILDPGFGFSKTVAQNYELMAMLRGFSILKLPLLVGVSRKSMIYKLLEITAEESLNATTVLNTYALQNGADILRVHDVKEAMETIRLISEIEKYRI